MPSVGGVTCDFVRGGARSLKSTVEVWRQPGFDGYGAQLTGQGDSESRFSLVRFGSATTVNTWRLSVEALQGTLISLTNDLGVAVSGFLVQRVGPVKITAADQGAGEVRGELSIEGVVAT